MQTETVERDPKVASALTGKHAESIRQLARLKRIVARRDPLALGVKQPRWLIAVRRDPATETGWALVPIAA